MEQTTFKPKVLVTILHQGWIRPELSFVMTNMQNDPRVDLVMVTTAHRPSENNRNWTVKEALDGGFDYLITIDHDTVPRRDPLDLIFLDLDVVGFAYPQWNKTDPKYPLFFLGMDKVPTGYTEHKNRSGLQEVDAVGSGCMVISRRVMEKVKEPFLRKWENGFAITGLDFFFCEKTKEAGFKVYCHYDYFADHFKEVSLLDVFNFKEA